MVATSDSPANERRREGTYLLVLPWDLSAVGGVNQVVIGLYEGIEKFSRLRPRVLQISWNDVQPIDAADSAGRQTTRCRIRSPFGRGPWLTDLVRYLLALPVEMLRIRDLVKRYDVRVVNCHYIGTAEFSWLLARSLGIFRGKIVLSLHGLDIRTLAKLRGVPRALWRWALSRADAVVACSLGLAEETIREFDLDPRQVVTIHNGVDPGRLERALLAAGVAPDTSTSTRRVLNLGTFEHKKGHDVLLRAFARVLERRGSVHLEILGRPGDTKDSTVALVQELKLQQHVSIVTNAPHAVALRALRSADVFVLSSRNEAFSVALLEAGALGKPIVATDVCGVAELISNRETGIVVPSEDFEALANGMVELLDDPAAAARYGNRLRDLVVQKFALDGTSRNYLALVGHLED